MKNEWKIETDLLCRGLKPLLVITIVILIETITKRRWRLKRLHTEPSPWSQYHDIFSEDKSYEAGDINFSKCHVTLF